MNSRLISLLMACGLLGLAGCPQPNPEPATSPAEGVPASKPEAPPPSVAAQWEREFGTVKTADPKSLIKSEQWGYVPAHLFVVGVKKDVSRERAEAIAVELGGKIVGESPGLRTYQIETAASTEAELRTALDKAARLEGVERVYPQQRARVFCCPNLFEDPVYAGDNAQGYKRIGLMTAWKYLKAAEALGVPPEPITAGMTDTPFYLPQRDEFDAIKMLIPRPEDKTNAAWMIGGKPFCGGVSHGTQVANVLAADPANGGVGGVAGNLGKKLTLLYAGGGDDPARMDIQVLLQCTDAEARLGARVINLSWGVTNPSPGLVQQCRELFAAHPNVLFVAAAGNADKRIDEVNEAPAGLRLPNVITVGNVDNSLRRFHDSNRPTGNGEVTLAAPGNQAIRGVSADGEVIKHDSTDSAPGGTSMAAPQVSGAAILIRSLDPTLTAVQVKQILSETAFETGKTRAQLREALKNEVPPPTDAQIETGYWAMQADFPKVLRVDKTIFHTLNGRLRREGKPEITEEYLRGFCEVQIAVSGSHPEFMIKVTLPSVGPKGAKIDGKVSGSFVSIVPDREMITQPSESVTFKVGVLDEQNLFTATRLDTGAKATVSLGKAEFITLLTAYRRGPLSGEVLLRPPPNSPKDKSGKPHWQEPYFILIEVGTHKCYMYGPNVLRHAEGTHFNYLSTRVLVPPLIPPNLGEPLPETMKLTAILPDGRRVTSVQPLKFDKEDQPGWIKNNEANLIKARKDYPAAVAAGKVDAAFSAALILLQHTLDAAEGEKVYKEMAKLIENDARLAKDGYALSEVMHAHLEGARKRVDVKLYLSLLDEIEKGGAVTPTKGKHRIHPREYLPAIALAVSVNNDVELAHQLWDRFKKLAGQMKPADLKSERFEELLKQDLGLPTKRIVFP